MIEVFHLKGGYYRVFTLSIKILLTSVLYIIMKNIVSWLTEFFHFSTWWTILQRLSLIGNWNFLDVLSDYWSFGVRTGFRFFIDLCESTFLFEILLQFWLLLDLVVFWSIYYFYNDLCVKVLFDCRISLKKLQLLAKKNIWCKNLHSVPWFL